MKNYELLKGEIISKQQENKLCSGGAQRKSPEHVQLKVSACCVDQSEVRRACFTVTSMNMKI